MFHFLPVSPIFSMYDYEIVIGQIEIIGRFGGLVCVIEKDILLLFLRWPSSPASQYFRGLASSVTLWLRTLV